MPAGPSPRPRVLVVDDDTGVLHAVRRLLGRGDVEVLLAQGPLEAIALLREKPVAVVISDQMMPVMTGVELLTLVRQNWPATVCIMMTACEDMRVAADVVNRRLVHFFVAKPWDSEAFRALVQDALELSRRQTPGLAALDGRLLREIRDQAANAAFSLARAVDARDRYTHRHSENVAAFALLLGRALGLADDRLQELRIGGLLHDVGKIGVSDVILLKPGRLTEAEILTIKTHPEIGVAIIEPISFPWNIAAIVGQHHENHDGTGYPKGLAGEEIALPARIIHVVDAYEAMAANRIYRTARSREWILAEFKRCRGTQFDPQLVDTFLEELTSGRIAAAAALELNPAERR